METAAPEGTVAPSRQKRRSLPDRGRRWARLTLKRHFGAPDLYKMLGPSGWRLSDTTQFIKYFAPLSDIEEFIKEVKDLREELENRRSGIEAPYARFHDIEIESMVLCYAITRALKPGTVVETGVGNGASTFFFLRALKKNGIGTLHSFDISSNVGAYLTEQDRRGWNLHVLSTRNPLKEFSRQLTLLPQVDLFMHDSHHRYKYMKGELSLASKALSERGVILCDDSESTNAFEEFCRLRKLNPRYLFDQTKFFGGVFPNEMIQLDN